MIEEGKLTRITLGDLSTGEDRQGLRHRRYAGCGQGRLSRREKPRPHKYQDKPAEYITWWKGGPRTEPYVQDDTARGIVYEIDGTGKVGAIHAGGPEHPVCRRLRVTPGFRLPRHRTEACGDLPLTLPVA